MLSIGLAGYSEANGTIPTYRELTVKGGREADAGN